MSTALKAGRFFLRAQGVAVTTHYSSGSGSRAVQSELVSLHAVVSNVMNVCSKRTEQSMKNEYEMTAELHFVPIAPLYF